jgi:hypothetical protein
MQLCFIRQAIVNFNATSTAVPANDFLLQQNWVNGLN